MKMIDLFEEDERLMKQGWEDGWLSDLYAGMDVFSYQYGWGRTEHCSLDEPCIDTNFENPNGECGVRILGCCDEDLWVLHKFGAERE